MRLRDQPLHTDYVDALDQVRIDPDRLLVYGAGREERSRDPWRALIASGIRALELRELPDVRSRIEVEGRAEPLMLRGREGLRAFWRETEAQRICCDITGVSNEVWAPLLRAALDVGLDVQALYVEPHEYNFSPDPTKGAIFALSDRHDGLGQVGGFELLDGEDRPQQVVLLLGFEGARAAHAKSELQSDSGIVIPVVGVPGFRVEYPLHTFQGNQQLLEQDDCWRHVRYAIANCPFSLFHTLEGIHEDHPEEVLQVAMLGTKPHALGAVLFAIAHEGDRSVALIHDHPQARSERTTGTAHVLVYDISAFMATLA